MMERGEMREERERVLKVWLIEAIRKEALKNNPPERIIQPDYSEGKWLIDLRSFLFSSVALSSVTELFRKRLDETITENSWQLGALELAGIPLMVALTLSYRGSEIEKNGFVLRKSRKKTGLLRHIEGQLTEDPIILIDDLMNRGTSLLQKIELLEMEGKRVIAVAVVLSFRENEAYESILSKGIKIISLCSLKEVVPELSADMEREFRPVSYPFEVEWKFQSAQAHHEWVVPKSEPLFYKEKLYFGSDSGNFYALDAENGKVAWVHRVLFGSQGKRIFSSPVAHNNTIFFGGYDGNFYALDAKTGKRKWVAQEGDWIGSSPTVSEKYNLVYVGLEFGLWKKRGGIAAYDMDSGKRVWQSESEGLMHASPVWSSRYDLVLCGANDNYFYAHDAKTGKRVWTFDAGGEVKARASLSPAQEHVAFASLDNSYYVLETKTGRLVARLETLEGNYSNPLWREKEVLVGASLDKCIYAWNVQTTQVLWKYETNGRIFASPVMIGSNIYCGSNDGLLHVVRKDDGARQGVFVATERITNAITVNETNDRFFVPTCANEVFCLRKTGSFSYE